MYVACFSEAEQQTAEQYGRWFWSLDPAHCTKATERGSLPSEGRKTLPPVGPEEEANRSTITLVTTFAYLPNPRFSIFLASYGAQPVATTTDATRNVFFSAFCARSTALYGQASTQARHFSGQALRSTTYFAGKAMAWGRWTALLLERP